LDLMDKDCPLQLRHGTAHRKNASLWAHAVELMARFGHADALCSLVTRPQSSRQGPFIKAAPYPHVLVAKAVQRDRTLFAVLHPGGEAGIYQITLGGLVPGAAYAAAGIGTRVVADQRGEAVIDVPLAQRLPLTVARTL